MKNWEGRDEGRVSHIFRFFCGVSAILFKLLLRNTSYDFNEIGQLNRREPEELFRVDLALKSLGSGKMEECVNPFFQVF